MSCACKGCKPPRLLTFCGTVCNAGAFGEPLACGFPTDHDGPHAWTTLPTFTPEPEPEAEAEAKRVQEEAS